MKRLFLLISIIAILFLGRPACSLAASKTTQTPNVKAASAILIDNNSGDILWQKNATEKRSIASTTKMMTAILAIEKGSLDTTVTVARDKELSKVPGFRISAGQRFKMIDLLYALMLNSANSSAVAIANSIGGSKDRFISLMNKKAIDIGAKHTSYSNPHGLEQRNHYSTAQDLALIARYAMRNKIFAGIVATKEKDLSRTYSGKVRKFESRNRLLCLYKGATGIKTGYTSKAGYCLVASAQRENVSLISVVLGAKSQQDVFDQSITLFDYGFKLYEKKRLVTKNKIYKKVKLDYGQAVNLAATRNVVTFARISAPNSQKVTINRNIEPPIKKGAILGKVEIMQSGRQIATASLASTKDVDKPGLFFIGGYYVKQLISSIF